MSWITPFRRSRKCRRLVDQLLFTNLQGFLKKNITRCQSTFQFYQNKQLEAYAAKEANRLTLRQLVFFGRSMNEERLLTSANYVRTELPVRIAHRLRDLQALPYVVVTQEGVAKVYELYWSAFEKFRRYPPVTSLEENAKFCTFLGQLLNEHAVVIPNLSLGLSLSSPLLPPDKLDSFMRRMLVSRISRRVLAEHHIALSESFSKPERDKSEDPHVGIIFTGLNLEKSVRRCGELLKKSPLLVDEIEGSNLQWPDIQIEGHLGAKFAYIREHFEYIVLELLKNAVHATILMHRDAGGLPPIKVTIVVGEKDIGLRISDQGGGLLSIRNKIKRPSDLFSFSHIRNATRLENWRLGALRTASEEGVRATVDEQVRRWQMLDQQTTQITNEQDPAESLLNAKEVHSHPRIGIGLPMSNIFATYFGGSLELVSLDGWGTDVYLRLPKLGTSLEGIEL